MNQKTCGTCRHYFKEGQMGTCRRNPPYAQMIPIQGRLGQVEMSLQGFWPPVAADARCGEWAPTLEVVQ